MASYINTWRWKHTCFRFNTCTKKYWGEEFGGALCVQVILQIENQEELILVAGVFCIPNMYSVWSHTVMHLYVFWPYIKCETIAEYKRHPFANSMWGMDEGLGWMVEEMGREELMEEVYRLKVMVGLDKHLIDPWICFHLSINSSNNICST